MFCAVSLSAGLSSCGQVPHGENDQSTVSNTSGPRSCVGQYQAKYVTGDFAGYVSLQQFVDKMAENHGFEREYLMGVFSQAHRKNWTLNYLAKSDQSLKGKPAAGGWDRPGQMKGLSAR